MKKNISINISGIIFHIEEDGYEILRKYLDSINRYFSAFEGSSEILADIESRIAEIFLAKLNEGKQVITSEDVSQLMATMGNVNDFKAAEEAEATAPPTQKSDKKESAKSAAQANKKLYRDQKRKILGGVCAGFAHYFSVDAVWIRLIIALLTLGYGGGLLLYIILWIVLPSSNDLEDEPSVKKMYRNPDQKVLGGVAGGIASFFAVDVVIIRVIFVLMAFGGIGFILYLILWISLPEAKTITEKMEMQGEPVTLSNIESTVKKNLNEKDDQEESTLAKIVLFPFRLLAMILNGMAKVLGPLFRVMVDILRVASGIIISIIGFTFVFSLLFAAGVALGLISSAPIWWGDAQLSMGSLPVDAIRNAFPGWTMTFAFLAGFIPALFLLLIGISIISKKVVFNSTIGWAMFVVFFISIAFLGVSVPRFIYSFKEEGEHKSEQTFEIGKGTPVLKVNEVGLDDYDVVELRIKAYDGNGLKLVKRFEAQGSTRKIAGENAQMVDYTVEQRDSTIFFDSNITFKKDAKFRAQRLKMELFIPYHQKFRVDKEMWRLINNNYINGYRHDEYNYNGYNYFDYENADGQIWEVTDKGLDCISCENKPSSSGEIQNDTKDFNLSIHDQYGLKGFDKLDISGIFRVQVFKGDEYSVQIEGDSERKERYDVYLDGETLVIDYEDKRKFFWKSNLLDEDKVKIIITMPSLKEVHVTGAGKVYANDFEEEDMEIKLLGAVVADFAVSSKNIEVDLTGASVLELKGKGTFMDANITGASGLRAYGYEVESANVEAHGASNAKVYVTQSLEIKKGIASNVSHRGDPEIIKTN